MRALRTPAVRKGVAVVAGLMMAVAIGVRTGYSQRQAQRSLVSSSAEWLPFRADLSILKPGGEMVDGKFFRSSDGSERMETWAHGDPSRKVIFIKNVLQETWYKYSPVTLWESGPMQLRSGYRPPRVALENAPRSQMTFGGRPLHEVRTTGGDNIAFADPALNMFVVVRQNLSSGYRETYSNIQQEEIQSDLFVPPPGADVIETTKVGGIVAQTVAEAQAESAAK